MKLLLAAVVLILPFKVLANCEVAYRQARDCINRAAATDALSKPDSLDVDVRCNALRRLCADECKKNTKDAETNHRYLDCEGRLAQQQQGVSEKLKKVEEGTKSPLTNPATSQGGVGVKQTPGSPGAVIQYSVPTNSSGAK